MRRFISCALLLGAVQGDGEQFIPEGGKSLEQVYGPVADVDETVPWDDRELSRAALPKDYFDRRTGDNCTFPIELYFVQDETGSFYFSDRMKNVELKKAFDGISKTHPGSTFGVGTHQDIPIGTLGAPEDHCWTFRLPLTSNWTALYNAYDGLRAYGGDDTPEYQFGAIIAAAQSDTPGWRNPLATRLIVVVTDARPHFEGDGFNKYGLKPYSRDGFDEAHADEQCETQYYPPPSQVRDALKMRKAYLAMLIFDGGNDEVGKPIEAWRWFNSYIGQSPEFVADVKWGATNFWEQLSTVIQELEDVECLPTTTTALPTTATELSTTSVTETETPTTATNVTETETTTIATTVSETAPTAEPVGTTEPECPPCQEPDNCPCPAVKIALQDKPVYLKLVVNNTEA